MIITPSIITQSVSSPQTSLKVGILGTGWGVRVQVPQFRAAGLEVTAIFSRDPTRAAELAQQHTLQGFSDDHALINSPDGTMMLFLWILFNIALSVGTIQWFSFCLIQCPITHCIHVCIVFPCVSLVLLPSPPIPPISPHPPPPFPPVDLVSIVTPPYLHCQQFKAALAAGKHVLVDKPMCLNSTEAEEMLHAATAVADPQRVIMVDHEMRFAPAFVRARDLVQSGALGVLGMGSVQVVIPPIHRLGCGCVGVWGGRWVLCEDRIPCAM